ncbi:hypothetical protein LCGC14_1573770 [marine sediment metagenome]|uniref:Uncharacterized protein n=1 Tax=marine sediment metagenome TaxID=412755 RepID=A0A0F9L036_9ZZZZ
MIQRNFIPDPNHVILLDKLDKLETIDKKLQLIYEWVKTGHINLAQFKRLTCDIVQADITYRLAVAVGDLSDDEAHAIADSEMDSRHDHLDDLMD